MMGGSNAGMIAVVLSVIEHYGWKHVTVLLDGDSHTNFYASYTKSLIRAGKNTAMAMSIIFMKRITEAILTENLKAAQLQSRGKRDIASFAWP